MVTNSLQSDFLERARETALAAAVAAGDVLRDGYPRVKAVRIKKGNPADIVTEFDVIAERTAVEIVKRTFPDHNLLTEEEGTEALGSDFTWLIDPLDGTTNFSQAIPAFCVSIALVYKGSPVLGVVHDPMRDETFYAEVGRGTTLNQEPVKVSGKTRLREAVMSVDGGSGRLPRPRRLRVPRARMRAARMAGSAALDLAYVACGRLDILYNRGGLEPWDFGAGALLITEAGGTVTDWDRALRYLQKCSVLAGPPDLHDRFLNLARRQSAWPWQRLWWRLTSPPLWSKWILVTAGLALITWGTPNRPRDVKLPKWVSLLAGQKRLAARAFIVGSRLTSWLARSVYHRKWGPWK